MSSSTLTRTVATGLAAALSAAALSAAMLGLAGSAHAQAGPVSCDASGASRFTPGVQAAPQPVAVTYVGDDRACQDPGGAFTSARITANFRNVTLSCLASYPGPVSGSGSGTVHWSNGEQSEVDLTLENSTLNSASVTGTVREGPFAGQRFTGKFATDLAAGAFKCSFGAPVGGVSSADFTGSYTVG
ncbi:hypothetical protein [Actinomadura sp. 9N215]|uniref:hypothetical protein n=1 Tax=Actinomadura sp. 9N215 TaxID=3375150 RepID=UPI003789E2DB